MAFKFLFLWKTQLRLKITFEDFEDVFDKLWFSLRTPAQIKFLSSTAKVLVQGQPNGFQSEGTMKH